MLYVLDSRAHVFVLNAVYRVSSITLIPHSLHVSHSLLYPPVLPSLHYAISPIYPASSHPTVRPETELWLFTPGELPTHYTAPDSPFCPNCRTALLSLTSYMSTLPTPPLHPSNAPALELAKEHARAYPETGPSARYPPSAALYMRHLLQEKVVTLGAAHVSTVQVLADAGMLCREYPGWDLGLNKFFFKIGNLPEVRPLPAELCFGKLREEDLAIVQARTSIPRTTRTLLSLENVGVLEKATGRPVAWTFLGLDGSLTTLHTEEDWRGRGIAKAVAVKIMREGAEGLAVDEQGEAWGHADVYEGNVQSESVCRSLGGEADAKIVWCRIDLGRADHRVE